VFAARWTWIVPLLGAALVFSAVLLTTPPGFRSLADLVVTAGAGPTSDAAAYAVATAATLALITLLVLGAACGGLDLMLRKAGRRNG
jgi:hypothetical protein